MALVRRGVPTIYLGGDVPEASWETAARHAKARAAVIGTPTPDDQAATVRAATALVAWGVPVLVAVDASSELPWRFLTLHARA